jgi:hypothetical protein
MTTTLNQIRSHSLCTEGWAKLLRHLNKTAADDEPLSLLTILESNGLDDAIWCLRTEPTPERIQRFALYIARRVEHLHPAAKACNEVTERYLSGQATKDELKSAYTAAYAAAYAAYTAANTANAAAAYAASAAAYAADAAANTADAAAYAADAAYTADAAAYAASAASAAAYAAEREAQAQIFKEIFA